MSILPETVIEQLEFCELHGPRWAAAAGAVGLTSAQVAVLTSAAASTRAAFEAAQAARLASLAATATLNAQAAKMRSVAATLIRQIKVFAEVQGDGPAVYIAAGLPQPATGSARPAPGKPEGITVKLEADGSVTLSWTSVNGAASSGAFFMVSRKLPGETAFTGIGGAAGSTAASRRIRFTDTTVPASAAGQGVHYMIQGLRGARAGEPGNVVVVQFGVGGGSAAATPMKARIAA